MSGNSSKNLSFLICLALTLAILAVFYQVRSFKFISFDDPDYITKNQNIQTGFTLKAIKWALTAGYACNWHPLTWISHMWDWQSYGSNPAGHHLTNLVLHIANTLLLFTVLRLMTDALWPSAFVSALFALHPLHVESVAWVAERKDVLSTFFWLLTMWAYVRYVKQPGIASYLLTLLVFAMGLMTKPMLVTLPFVLLLLDYWPLTRILSGQTVSKIGRFQWQTLYYLILEKIPFIVLSTASSVITFLVQRSSNTVAPTALLPLKFRISNALISYVEYIEKMGWPSRLAVFYPHAGPNVSILYAAISAVLLLAVTILILRFAANHRYLVTGWFWYIGTLVPVIGIVQVGRQAMADRYSYITLTGLFIIIAWGLPELLGKWPYRKIVLWASSLIVLSALAICTYFQVQYWKDSMTVYQHAIDVTENNYTAHFAIAWPLIEQGRLEEGIRHYSEAIRVKPDYVDALHGLGFALYKAGRIDEAIGYYKRVLEIDPCYVEVYSNLGNALAKKGRVDEAISVYNKALKIAPDLIQLHINLGVALFRSGKSAEAEKEYEKVLFIQPQNAVAHNGLGAVLSQQGKFDQAIEHFKQAVRIDPNYTAAENNLNLALAEKQKLQNKDTENTGK
jgi:tetratricopeptide (TPR) repeat protein